MDLPRDNLAIVTAIALGGLLAACSSSAFAGAQAGPAQTLSTYNTEIRMARSEDGRKFKDTGRVFLQGAAAPDLARLPRGELLAVFDYAFDAGEANPTVLAIARSKNDGRSWSAWEPVVFRGRAGAVVQAKHGNLVRMRGGRLRLFFASYLNGRSVIRSAVTRDGVDYRLDDLRIELARPADPHPVAVWFDERLHLFVAGMEAAGGEHDERGAAAWHFMSPDGQRFFRLPPIRAPGPGFIGSLVALGGRVRAYTSAEGSIHAHVSRDGHNWRLESKTCVESGWDPAVVRLEDGSYLMLYCAAIPPPSRPQPELVAASSDQPFDHDPTMAEMSGTDRHVPAYEENEEQAAGETRSESEAASTYALEDEWPDEEVGDRFDDQPFPEEGSAYDKSRAGADEEYAIAPHDGAVPAIIPGPEYAEPSPASAPSSGPDYAWPDNGSDEWVEHEPTSEGSLVLDGASGFPDEPSSSWGDGESPSEEGLAEEYSPGGADEEYRNAQSGAMDLAITSAPRGPDDDSAEQPKGGADGLKVVSIEPTATESSPRPRGDQETAGSSAAGAERPGERDARDSGEAVEGPPDGAPEEGTEAERTAPVEYDWSEHDPSEFVPKPDFNTRIDYVEWYERHALRQPEDNAYDAYAEFIPGPNDEPGSKPEWPELHDMFNDSGHEGPPGPWDPAEHPEWEASHGEVRELLDKFREATTHEGYSQPRIHGSEQSGLPEGERLLITLLLPQLSSHRRLSRATLAAAWRVDDDGTISIDRTLEAWRTALGGAGHMAQGATLIEELVAMAERNLTRRNALWALQHGVFTTADEIERALELLVRYDRRHPDPTLAVRGEHAMSMDLTQYFFKPAKPGEPPRFDRERAAVIRSWFDDFTERHEELFARVADMTAEELQATVDALDAYYREMARLMRIGYPEVRTADIAALMDKYVYASPWTELLVPDLRRVYKLRARSETWRRATQLTFAVHLFRARQGRWPASLDELPVEHGAELRIDPFSGRDFGYRLDEHGPRIYSLSENARDDGGVHAPRWDDEVETESDPDDFVFWPPQPEPPRKT